MNWIRQMATLGVALSWLVVTPAWAAAGYIFNATGDVSMAVAKGAAQRAVRNTPVVSDAVITTGDRSHAVIKFEDGQVVAMQSNSTFHVRGYRYVAAEPERSAIFFSMLKGGMRFVTGLIGQRNKEAFRLITTNATIGIRGTDFMVAMAADNTMYSQVVSGGIGMTNAAGTVAVGAGETVAVYSAATLPVVIPATALPAGTFTQLSTIPVPSGTPTPAPAGGAASGGASASTTTAAGATAGVSATTIAVGTAVAAGIAAVGSNTTSAAHH